MAIRAAHSLSLKLTDKYIFILISALNIETECIQACGKGTRDALCPLDGISQKDVQLRYQKGDCLNANSYCRFDLKNTLNKPVEFSYCIKNMSNS